MSCDIPPGDGVGNGFGFRSDGGTEAGLPAVADRTADHLASFRECTEGTEGSDAFLPTFSTVGSRCRGCETESR